MNSRPLRYESGYAVEVRIDAVGGDLRGTAVQNRGVTVVGIVLRSDRAVHRQPVQVIISGINGYLAHGVLQRGRGECARRQQADEEQYGEEQG